MNKILLLLLFAVAINAFAGGLYGMSGADAIPAEWLSGSIFSSYFIPSLFLFFVVGGSNLFAAFAVLKRFTIAKTAARIAGMILILWIIAQIAVIGWVSWLQPLMLLVGVCVEFASVKNSK